MKYLIITLLLTFSFSSYSQIHKIYLEGEVGYFFPYQEALKAEALISLGKHYPTLAKSYKDYVKITDLEAEMYKSEILQLRGVITENNKMFDRFHEITNNARKENANLKDQIKSLKKSNRNMWFIIGGVAILYIITITAK